MSAGRESLFAAAAYAAIKDAAAVKNDDDPRTLAEVAIRDGEAWNDRRLPEMGRALAAALDAIDRLAAIADAARELRSVFYADDHEYGKRARETYAALRALDLALEGDRG